jgi:hypothetical protein
MGGSLVSIGGGGERSELWGALNSRQSKAHTNADTRRPLSDSKYPLTRVPEQVTLINTHIEPCNR